MTREQIERGVKMLQLNNPGYREATLSFVSGETAYLKVGRAVKRFRIVDKSGEDPISCSVCGGKGHPSLHAYTVDGGYDGIIVSGYALSTTDHKKSCSRRKMQEHLLGTINRLFR